jgi:uncharacterized damage-inducible protein DinB
MSVYSSRELAAAFRTVRNNTIQIAEEIPEEQYSFVPAPGTKSVSELLRHIAFGTMIHYDFHRDKKLTTLKGYDFGVMGGRMSAEERKPRNKTEIIALLKKEGDEFETWLRSLSPDVLAETFTDMTEQNPRSRLEHLMGAKEHEMHHRGQLMLIQRMIGLVPHLTRQREERARVRAAAAQAAQ